MASRPVPHSPTTRNIGSRATSMRSFSRASVSSSTSRVVISFIKGRPQFRRHHIEQRVDVVDRYEQLLARSARFQIAVRQPRAIRVQAGEALAYVPRADAGYFFRRETGPVVFDGQHQSTAVLVRLDMHQPWRSEFADAVPDRVFHQ